MHLPFRLDVICVTSEHNEHLFWMQNSVLRLEMACVMAHARAWHVWLTPPLSHRSWPRRGSDLLAYGQCIVLVANLAREVAIHSASIRLSLLPTVEAT